MGRVAEGLFTFCGGSRRFVVFATGCLVGSVAGENTGLGRAPVALWRPTVNANDSHVCAAEFLWSLVIEPIVLSVAIKRPDRPGRFSIRVPSGDNLHAEAF